MKTINLNFYVQLPATPERLDAYNTTLQECEEFNGTYYIDDCEIDVNVYMDSEEISIQEIVENAPNNVFVTIDESELQDSDIEMIEEIAAEHYYLV